MTRDAELLARHEPLLAPVNLDAIGNILLGAERKPVLNRSDTSNQCLDAGQISHPPDGQDRPWL